jgi:biotin transport system substrate-specific component
VYTTPSVTPRRSATLADSFGPRSLARDGALVVAFSLFMALCAQISIPLPWTPVPITGQTLGLLLTGAILGPRRGALAMLLYLAEGAAGLPVFAPSATLPGGLGRLLGPTGGYLFSYPIVAALLGLLAVRGWDRRIPSALLMFLIGNVVVYLFGVSWLNIYKGTFGQVSLMWAGVYPFLIGDAIKIGLAALALPGAWALFGKRSEDKAKG